MVHYKKKVEKGDKSITFGINVNEHQQHIKNLILFNNTFRMIESVFKDFFDHQIMS